MEQLLTALSELKDRLNKSGLERTVGIKNAMGEGCDYYKKSLKIFLDRDIKEIETLVDTVKTLLEYKGTK